jgi:hypothetical protein
MLVEQSLYLGSDTSTTCIGKSSIRTERHLQGQILHLKRSVCSDGRARNICKVARHRRTMQSQKSQIRYRN